VKRCSELWNGYCKDGYILYISSPITLFHELGHFYALGMQKYIDSGAVYLFLDFLQGVWEFINGVLRYKAWRNEVHKALNFYVLQLWSDFLDFELCRDKE
jgi:hypothetical protein